MADMTDEQKLHLLDVFADAWNRHDLDTLMACMTDDCVFEASAGLDVYGMRHAGKKEVSAAFAEVFANFPDAQWRGARHFVAGERGVSEWMFTGTRVDGARVEVNGCDLLMFRDGKIAVKNSYRKNRPPLGTSTGKENVLMSTEDNKAIVRRYVDAWNTGTVAALDEVLSADFVDYMMGRPRSAETLKQQASSIHDIYPDFYATVEDMIVEGDKVACRVTYQGTDRPTGKQAKWTGMFIARIADGKMVEGWGEVDRLGRMQQLGETPAPGQAGS